MVFLAVQWNAQAGPWISENTVQRYSVQGSRCLGLLSNGRALREFLHCTPGWGAAASDPSGHTRSACQAGTASPLPLLRQGWIYFLCFYSADLCALSFKSPARDSLRLAYIEIITAGLKESKIMKNTVFRVNSCLDVTEKRDGKIILWTTPEIRW